MPRSVDSSVRWRASSCMRWSGLTPIGPALASRKARPRLQPLADEVAHQALAQLELGHLAEPASAPTLRTSRPPAITQNMPSCDQEAGEVAPRQRIVEGLVPAVEADLAIGREHDDDEDARRRGASSVVAHRRGQERPHHHGELGEQPGMSGLLDLRCGLGDARPSLLPSGYLTHELRRPCHLRPPQRDRPSSRRPVL